MGDLGVLVRIVMRQPDVLVTFSLTLLILVPAAAMLARHGGWSRPRVFFAALGAAAFAPVPATTLGRGHVLVGWHRTCIVNGALTSVTPEALLNAALFAPAAFFAVLAVQRVGVVLLVVMACSTTIEFIQLVTNVGICETADAFRNTAGAAAAAMVAALLRRLVIPDRTRHAVRTPTTG